MNILNTSSLEGLNNLEHVEELDHVVIRFAGDSGDGMQLTGSQFTTASAVAGNSLSTLPDFPSEIRAPQGTVAGVSGFQIQFGDIQIYTPGDEPDVLVAMNPAALKANINNIKKGGTVVVDEDSFNETGLEKAGYKENPLDDNSLSGFKVFRIPMTKLTRTALEELPLDTKSKDRCRNFFALGLMFWMYSRPTEPTEEWINEKFANKPDVKEANLRALHAGMNCGTATQAIPSFIIKSAPIKPGTYKNIAGNEAAVFGLMAGAKKAGRKLFLGSYPITPASDILHLLAKYKNHDVVTFQAEDEIAAVCSSIGASFGGALAVTSTSGPGLALKAEALGLAVKTELPLVVVDVQRAGPSTGMPTKMEQSDLLCTMFGRSGDSPLCVIAANSPSHCFDMAFEACRIALEFMTPVILLTDGYLGNGSEPWLIPSLESLPNIKTKLLTQEEVKNKSPESKYLPYKRDEMNVRPWAVPGMKGFEHRLSGLEGLVDVGTISYDAVNHEKMVKLRQQKIKNIAKTIPQLEVHGAQSGELLILGWGSSFGSVRTAVDEILAEGKSVGHAHLNYINPFPENLEKVLKSYRQVLIPENNCGQLNMLIRSEFLIDTKSFAKPSGLPFKVREVKDAIRALI